ncbi:MAG: holo-[acyl-carrier-protein] synthase, partial [Cyanobacteria bacterium]|nr:holo-[acyl-carrier-protein] synthase [Cyanobacteriota bacterium]
WTQGIQWKEVEIQLSASGAPHIHLTGSAAEKAKALNISDWRISISHDGAYAMANVLGLIRE